MDFEEKVDPYNIGTLLTPSEYRAFQNRFPPGANEALDIKMEEIAGKLATESLAGRKYNVYSGKQKSGFLLLQQDQTVEGCHFWPQSSAWATYRPKVGQAIQERSQLDYLWKADKSVE